MFLYGNSYLNAPYRDVGLAVHGATRHPPMLAVVPTLGALAVPVPAASDPLRGLRHPHPASAKPPVERTRYRPPLVNGVRAP